jgi:rod shape-determining protein MreC
MKLPTNAASLILGSIQKVFFSAKNTVNNSVAAIGELRNLRSQYDALAKKLEKYSEMQREYTDILSENARLKEQLGYVENVPSIRLSARIIAKDPGNVYSSIVIDKGLNAGVVRDMPVVAFQDGVECLAGRILEARANTSIILPIYDKQFYVAARMARTRAEGLVEGRGKTGTNLMMRYVSKLSSQELQKGDVVVSSGLDSIFPPDLTIGRVSDISLPDYASSATLSVDSSLRFDKLEYVFLLDPMSLAPGNIPQPTIATQPKVPQ